MSDHESIPYYQSNYPELLRIYGDTAQLLLTNYGAPAIRSDGQPVTVTSWNDPEIATKYQLVGFREEASVDPRIIHQVDLTVTELFPNGEESVTVYQKNTVTGACGSQVVKRTIAQQAEYDARAKRAIQLPSGVRVLPPRAEDFDSVQQLDLLVSVLGRGLELLEH